MSDFSWIIYDHVDIAYFKSQILIFEKNVINYSLLNVTNGNIPLNSDSKWLFRNKFKMN